MLSRDLQEGRILHILKAQGIVKLLTSGWTAFLLMSALRMRVMGGQHE